MIHQLSSRASSNRFEAKGVKAAAASEAEAAAPEPSKVPVTKTKGADAKDPPYIFKGYNLESLGVPAEAWPHSLSKGNHNYTLTSWTGAVPQTQSQEIDFRMV